MYNEGDSFISRDEITPLKSVNPSIRECLLLVVIYVIVKLIFRGWT